MFDFSSNDFSGLFRSSCFSAKEFVKRFAQVVWKNRDSQATTEMSEENDSDVIPSVGETSTGINNSGQRTAKRKLSISDMESSPVPVKRLRKDKGEESKKENDASCPDVTFLQNMNKHAVPGRFISGR